MKTFEENISNVFIDIDDTITKDLGESSIKGAIETIKALSGKVNVYVWSQGGVSYALEIVKKLKLEEFVCGVIPKPDMIIDDLKLEKWCSHMEPDWNEIKRLTDILERDWIEDSCTLRRFR